MKTIMHKRYEREEHFFSNSQRFQATERKEVGVRGNGRLPRAGASYVNMFLPFSL
jgi:hypothetical protein